MSIKQSKAITLRFYEVLESGNFEQAQEVVASNFIAHIPGTSAPLDLNAFMQLSLQFRAAFPNGKQILEDIIGEEDKVVTRGIFSGIHQGEILGIPATGKLVKLPVMHIDHLVDGKIAEHWGQGDFLGTMLQQLGVGVSRFEKVVINQ